VLLLVFVLFFGRAVLGKKKKVIAKGTKDSFGNKCAKLARYM